MVNSGGRAGGAHTQIRQTASSRRQLYFAGIINASPLLCSLSGNKWVSTILYYIKAPQLGEELFSF